MERTDQVQLVESLLRARRDRKLNEELLKALQACINDLQGIAYLASGDYQNTVDRARETVEAATREVK